MKVLIACEFSGVVRDAFRARGHEAWSCDLLEAPGCHIQGDVLDILDQGWDLMVAHPPCTYLANSGVCWLHRDAKRWISMYDGAEFFNTLLNAQQIPKRCVENPVMHKYARKLISKPAYMEIQTVQPWQFGHGETKATQLWLKGLPKLVATDIVEGREQRLHKLPPSPDRAKLRSITYNGIAQAMAEQWGNI